MRSSSLFLAAALVVAAVVPSHAALLHRGKSSKHKAGKSHAKAEAHPRAIDDTRAVEIQNALVKAGYLKEASGHWDGDSQAAMQKLQADNGWQTKLIPDSRALIKLGLGPNSQASLFAPHLPESSGDAAEALEGK